MRTRGSVWKNPSRKAGYSLSLGSYEYRDARMQTERGDRYFVLTSIKSGKTRVYESTFAAIDDGWFIVKHGK